MSQPPRKHMCSEGSIREATGNPTGDSDMQQPRSPSQPDTRPGPVLGDILGDMPMESSDGDLEMPDSHQLASSPVLTAISYVGGVQEVAVELMTERGGGGWGSAGGGGVSAAEAVSDAVPMPHETAHSVMAQSGLGHTLPQTKP